MWVQEKTCLSLVLTKSYSNKIKLIFNGKPPKYKVEKNFTKILMHKHVPNEKDAMTSCCLDRKEVRCANLRVHSGAVQLVSFMMDTYKVTFSVIWQTGLRRPD